MKDPRIEKYANVILDYCIKLKKDQLICLRGSSLAEPLMLELYKAALLKGAHPFTRVLLQGLEEIYFKYSSEKQLKFITPIQKYELNNSDAMVAIISSFNTKELTNIDPQKQAVAQIASKPIMEKTMKRAAQGKFSWVGCLYPTNASAQDAGMSLSDYENFVFKACLLDKKDPVGEWKKISRYNSRLIKYLSGKKEIRIVAPDTDLTFNIKGRKWINCDGKNNFPDGEIFTAPWEKSANGYIRYSFPAVYHGREVEDVRIEFKNLERYARHGSGRALSGRVGHRHQFRNQEFHQKHTFRRENRRHRSFRAGNGLPGNRKKPIGIALGYGMRPAEERRHVRRRADVLQKREISEITVCSRSELL
jgi:aminopeptidase